MRARPEDVSRVTTNQSKPITNDECRQAHEQQMRAARKDAKDASSPLSIDGSVSLVALTLADPTTRSPLVTSSQCVHVACRINDHDSQSVMTV